MAVKALEFYSGIGGLHLAFSRSNVEGSFLQAFDWDQTACQVYEANHGPGLVKKVDITTLTASQLGAYEADLWLMSPACQPYTVLNPNAKGERDPRAQSFLHLITEVLPEMAKINAHPSYILVENVAGFEVSTTRQLLLTTLRSLGYTTLELLLTPLQYGVPNSRLRYYLLAKKRPLTFHGVSIKDADEVLRSIPGQKHWRDPRLDQASSTEVESSASSQLVRQIQDYLDEPASDRLSHPNRIPDKVLLKWGRLFDIVLPSSNRTCCFTRGYSQLVERAGSILQANTELNASIVVCSLFLLNSTYPQTTEIFDAFLAAQSKSLPSEQCLAILHPLGLRYFSPSELLRIFDFTPIDEPDARFIWPEGISTKSKYRLIGNSVNVRVVQQLIEYLFQY